MHNELTPSTGRTLNELRTIQYLEETVGPAGLRRLADTLHDADQRAAVQELRLRAASASLELESIIEDWSDIAANKPRVPKLTQPGGLEPNEIVESFVEVKRASAELLRRASRGAPNDKLRERLLALANAEEDAAARLSEIAPTGGEATR